MLILLHKADLERLPSDTPPQVREKIAELITALDRQYGTDRNLTGNGGYVVYLSKNDNIHEVLKEIDIDLDEDIPKYVDTVGNYINTLYMFYDNYGVNLIMPKSIAPKSLLLKL